MVNRESAASMPAGKREKGVVKKRGERSEGECSAGAVDDRTIVSTEKGCNGGKEGGEKKIQKQSAPGVQDWLCEMRLVVKELMISSLEMFRGFYESWARMDRSTIGGRYDRLHVRYVNIDDSLPELFLSQHAINGE